MQRWILIILILALIYTVQNPPERQISIPETDLNPIGKQEAWEKTEEWLTDQPLGANANIIGWNGSDDTMLASGSDTIDATIHHLSVQSDTGWWNVDITVTKDGTLVGQPSVSRQSMDETLQTNDTYEWDGILQTLQPSDALTATVNAWAKALMGDDEETLTTLIGDEPNAYYEPLNLGVVSDVTIGKAAYLKRGKIDKNNETSDTAALRATITLEPTIEQGRNIQYTYDLLIDQPDGTPRVQAWGAPGTGAGLEPYQNRTGVKETQ